ncbi:hypothetical protein Tco_0572766 [Tanacetum coccineum]
MLIGVANQGFSLALLESLSSNSYLTSLSWNALQCEELGSFSGAIKLYGSYNPSGLILDYILSGSPAIASNTWPVMGFSAHMMIESMDEYWKKKRCSKTMASSAAIA